MIATKDRQIGACVEPMAHRKTLSYVKKRPRIAYHKSHGLRNTAPALSLPRITYSALRNTGCYSRLVIGSHTNDQSCKSAQAQSGDRP